MSMGPERRVGQCNCPCHKGSDFDDNYCTAKECHCGNKVLQIPTGVSQFSLSSTKGNIGRVDHSTSFRPIGQNAPPPLPSFNDKNDAFDNILELNNIRSDSLDALSPERKQNSKKDIVFPSVLPQQRPHSSMQSFGVTTPKIPLLFPPDYFLQSSTVNEGDSGKSKEHARRNIFPAAPVTDMAISNFNLLTRPSSSARNTPLTHEELSSRLVAPDEFTKKLTFTQSNPEEGNSTQQTLDTEPRMLDETQKVADQGDYTGANFSFNTFLTQNTVPSYSTEVSKVSVASASSAETPSLASSSTSQNCTATVNPLSEFCSKIGLSSENNTLLPVIPGGKEKIVARLDVPDPNVLESLRRSQLKGEGAESSDKSSESESKAAQDTILVYDDMPYRVPGGQKPYIAVFWDIENCQVPRFMDASSIARNVRRMFYGHHIEYEFFVVMDVYKEKEEITRELQRAQVMVVHVCKGEKNAADEKLVYLMRQYSNYHQTGNTCILISGDTNFTTTLHDMRHKNHINTILLHNNVTNEQLKSVANFCYNFNIVTDQSQMRPGAIINNNNNNNSYGIGPSVRLPQLAHQEVRYENSTRPSHHRHYY